MPSFKSIQEEISSMLSVPDDELTPEQRAAMDTYLDDLGRMEADKVDAFGQFLRLEQDRVDALKQESSRLSARAKAAQKRIDGLKNHYLVSMQTAGVSKIRGDVYVISLRKSQQVQAPEDAAALEKLWEKDPVFVRRKVDFQPDKAAIKEAIAAGMMVDGCSLRENYSLQIR